MEAESHGGGGGGSTTEEMASLMLKGWAMLSETCSKCREVPLMRSRGGILRCCRCHSESTVKSDASNTDAVESNHMGEHNKYRIVDECGLESDVLRGIHREDGDKLLMNVDRPARRVSAFDDRRVRQLCLLKYELSMALDRYTTLLHKFNESGFTDVASEVPLLHVIDSTLKLLDSVDKNI